ncbi:autotransporter domain-containing protein [Luteibacter sp. 329MFSha]|uniref:autotransporter domain-containing protein n=1 Tax=Luteibacter sp. 329MFSha TaxID=1798239 RepID=UPI0008CC9661|nr:autotransporter domain-containing protein [Luteibacter sp. 329MFSha]SEW25469.1 autotransporter-associated beta strand repeat-containing protein [Luteibacter sp. 329MFSha]
MEELRGVAAPGRVAVGVWGKPCAIALAVALALGLSACGGGGGGGGNVRPTPPPATGGGGTAPGPNGNFDVAANVSTVVPETLAGAIDVVKTGAGTLTLTGYNTYGGRTQVNAGALYVNGDQTAAKGATTVAAGATLGGSGILGGDVTVADGATLSPGDRGKTGVLTLNGSLRLSSASILDFGFLQAAGGVQSGDLINVRGDLTLDGILHVDVASGGDPGPGVHRLFNYGGVLTDNGLSLGNMPSTGWYVQTGVAHEVNLIDTRGMRFGFWDGAGAKGNNAIDGGDGTWSADPGNDTWTDASGAANAGFSDGSFAVFQGRPGTVSVDGGSGPVNVSGMQFAVGGYAVRGGPIHLVGDAANPARSTIRVGDGSILSAHMVATVDSVLDGDAMLVKTDHGTLALGANNTYRGGTTVDDGVLQVGTGGTTGWIVGDVTNNSVFAFNRSDDVTYGGVVSGSGTLVQSGTGRLTLTGVNTHTGGTTVRYGILEVAPGATLGSGDIVVDVNDHPYDPAATLRVDHGVTLPNAVWLMGHGMIDNAGVLSGNTFGMRGMSDEFFDGGTVWNHDGGIIRGIQSGVGFGSAMGTVRNGSGGLIEGGDAAVDLLAGGAIYNDGSGTRIASDTGLAARTAWQFSSIRNTAGATLSGRFGAIQMQAGGSVGNDGIGSSIVASSGRGIEATGATASVSNTGGALISSAGTAIWLQRGGSVTNGAGSVIETTGTRRGDCSNAECAIYVATDDDGLGHHTGGGLTLVNAGSIIGDVQMFRTASNSVTLSAGSSIHGDLQLGTTASSRMTVEGDAGTVQLYSQAVTGRTTFDNGYLWKTGNGSWIFDNDDLRPGSMTITSGTVQVGNGGTTGSLGAPFRVDLYNASLVFNRSDDIAFDGLLVGSHTQGQVGYLVQAGTGKLTLTQPADISSLRVRIERGTLQIDDTGSLPGSDNGSFSMANVENDGALIYDSQWNIFAGVTSGTGSVTQNGSASLIMDLPNTYAGGTTVNKGRLQSSYTLPGDAAVNASGTVTGIGRGYYVPGFPGVTGSLFNAGVVSVRGGDTKVGGDYVQSPTATIALDLGSKVAVDGMATLGGGTLRITGADSGYVANTHTDVLTANGGVTGAFDRLVKDTGVVFTATTINYTPNSVWLDTTGLDVTTAAAGDGVSYTAASFRSAQRVQAAFDQIDGEIAASGSPSASNGSPAVTTAFVQAAGEFQQAPSLQAAQASLRSLSGELHAASAAMTFESIDASNRALSDRLDALACKSDGYGMWTQSLNVGGDMGRTGYDGIGFQLNGWLVGSDSPIGTSGVAGFAFGQSTGRQQLDRSADRNRSRNTDGMFYAGWLDGNWYAHGRLGFGRFHQDVDRRLLLGTSAQGVSTNYSGSYSVAYGETGLRMGWAGTLITPFFSTEYARIDRDGFAEDGAGGFGLRANAQVIDRWQAGLGLRASRQWNFAGGRSVAVRASAQFQRTLASQGDIFDASFVGLHQWQPLTGVGLSRYRGILNVGIDAALSERTSLTFGYDYQKGQRDQAQGVSARMLMAF